LLLSLHQSLFLYADLSFEISYAGFLLEKEIFEFFKPRLFFLRFSGLEGLGFFQLPEELDFLLLHVANLLI